VRTASVSGKRGDSLYGAAQSRKMRIHMTCFEGIVVSRVNIEYTKLIL
jgi:hypothetical protein